MEGKKSRRLFARTRGVECARMEEEFKHKCTHMLLLLLLLLNLFMSLHCIIIKLHKSSPLIFAAFIEFCFFFERRAHFLQLLDKKRERLF
jgi:hypothetical protein